jgi:hypothetical protein
MKTKQEHSINAKSCYSNIPAYGVNGRTAPIIAPQPATVVPQLFNHIPPNRHPKYTQPTSESIWYARNCKPYSTLNGKCG